MSISKNTREIGLSLMALGILLWCSSCKFSFSADEHVKTDGHVKAKAEFNTDEQAGKGGGGGDESYSPATMPEPVTPPALPPAKLPEEFGDIAPARNITDLWVSERSGKAYLISENAGDVEVFEDGPDHQKRSVGHGTRNGSGVTVQFHSTLDNVDGVLELGLSKDGKTLDGHFRGLDPTKEGRVRLLRASQQGE